MSEPAPAMRLQVNRRLLDSRLGVPYLRQRASMKPLLPTAESDAFIDGFPRTANSYTFYAVKVANPDRVIHGHTHSSDAIRVALSQGTPTLVLIREPRGCVASFVQFVPGLSPESALEHYRRFYGRLLPLAHRATIATFPEVTSDLAQVVQRLNDDTGAGLVPYRATDSNEASVSALLDHSNRRFAGGREGTSARPSAHRRSADDVLSGLSRRGLSLMDECADLYESVHAQRR